MKNYDVIIVGAGVAGMTSAIYCLRTGKTVLVLECNGLGGQIALSPRVENFPSIKQISGSELSDKMFEQISELGAELELEKALSINKRGEGDFVVNTDYNSYGCKSVILATGVSPRSLGVAGEDELVGKGVSYCAVCDGAFYAGEEVVLIGDANTALQYAILLSNYCKKVTICTLFDRFFGEKRLVNTLLERDNVEVFHNLQLEKYLTAGEELSGLVFHDTTDQSIHEFACKAVFIAVGQMPHNEAFGELVQLDEGGYIVADEDMQTSTDGIYVAGDCRRKKIRQLTTAVADGSIAAVRACGYIDSLGQ